MIHIKVMNQSGEVLREAIHPMEAMVCVDRIWEKGDTVLFLAPAGSHLQIAVDASMLQGEVYLPNGIMHWTVPFGEHRLAYMPGLFDGKRQYPAMWPGIHWICGGIRTSSLTVRPMWKRETNRFSPPAM